METLTTAANLALNLPPATLAVAGLSGLAFALGTLKAAVAAGTRIARMDPETRSNTGENLLVGCFLVVVGGLIMQGLIGFARDEMGLSGPWPYLLFFALDGLAAVFGVAQYRWAREGASPAFPRGMVISIVLGSSWFQWSHAAGLPFAGRVAWAALPILGGILWEFVLVQRRKSWKAKQQPKTEAIPRARWLLAPIQSAFMKRRMVLWGTASYEEAVDLHITRVEAIHRLRAAYGLRWASHVPADVAYRLRAGVRIQEAAARVDEILQEQSRPVICGRAVPVSALMVRVSPPRKRPARKSSRTIRAKRPVPTIGDIPGRPEGLNEDVIRAYHQVLDAGDEPTVSRVAEMSGVPRATAGRHLQKYLETAPLTAETAG